MNCNHQTLFLKADQCYGGYGLAMENKLDLIQEDGTQYFKKILQANFAKEALLQRPKDMNCMKDTEDRTCAFPYNYKGTNMYACTDSCSSSFTKSEILSYSWSKYDLTTLDTENNLGECKHQCSISETCLSLNWDQETKVKVC